MVDYYEYMCIKDWYMSDGRILTKKNSIIKFNCKISINNFIPIEEWNKIINREKLINDLINND
jgi:hypothetical protein